jgi:RNA polymerase sigma-70 factor (ECF subfamily)
MIEEQKLVTRILAGEAEAEDIFYKLFSARLLRASMHFLGGQDAEAEDIVQETFIIAFPKLKFYDFRAPIFAWLRQICLHLCYTRMRTRKKLLLILQEDLERVVNRAVAAAADEGGLEMEKQGRLKLLGDLKKRLSPESRRVVEMRDVQGLTYAHISHVLTIPIGTVMSRLSRARQQLKAMVETVAGQPLPGDALAAAGGWAAFISR